MKTTTTNPIAELNDKFRKELPNRYWRFTQAARENVLELIKAIATFDTFTEDNDPYGEHDFGSIEIEGEKYFWKIDYFDLDLKYGSPDPNDPQVTRRFITVMHSSEY
jgi:hypothetical protein